MEISTQKLEDLKALVNKKFSHFFKDKTFKDILSIEKKPDGSFVTALDYAISDEIKDFFKDEISKGLNYYSEEDYGELKYPGIFLDPVDGTSQLCQGHPEVSVSFCYLNSARIDDPLNFAWIYNPFTAFSISSKDFFIHPPLINPKNRIGMISRREYSWILKNMSKDEYESKLSSFHIVPMGSIAYKLGLLASGACSFVLSYRNKKIWDLAAGAILLERRGYVMLSKGKILTFLDQNEFTGPFLWCRKEELPIYQEIFI